MRRVIARWLVRWANGETKTKRAATQLTLATRLDPAWSVPWYNLALLAKYEARWQDSVRFNQRALELNSSDEAAWWNLGIAATALHDWTEARRAWQGFGVELTDGGEEVSMAPSPACVRLNPGQAGEVVWGERIDPARTIVLSVPLPESSRRFRDIILNDGATSGVRTWDNVDYPVFDELAVWLASKYSTFQAELHFPDSSAEEKLRSVCDSQGVGCEDWTTIRMICEKCSHANPGPHECKPSPPQNGLKRFGFGAQERQAVEDLLRAWTDAAPGASYQDLNVVLEATA